MVSDHLGITRFPGQQLTAHLQQEMGCDFYRGLKEMRACVAEASASARDGDILRNYVRRLDVGYVSADRKLFLFTKRFKTRALQLLLSERIL
jgi:hypothetical protein